MNENNTMSQVKIILTASIAMFAMFFGSGNLVFPLRLGTIAGDQYILSITGLILTGVAVPFMGLLSMILYRGDRDEYFGSVGKFAPLLLSTIMLCLLGPFGVVPRCILVAYGGVNVLYPHIPFGLFSAIFSLMVLAVILPKKDIVLVIGRYLGPLKITCIIFVVVVALIRVTNHPGISNLNSPFSTGLVEGYQTMDLLAAFFFGSTVVEYLNHSVKREQVIRIGIISSFVAGGLIAVIYTGFVMLGAYYSSSLVGMKPEQYLTHITLIVFGKNAGLIIAITMLVSCLTTASALSKVFAAYLSKDIMRNKISLNYSIIITIMLSFLLSLTGFATISRMLASILEYLYPSLIILAISLIVNKYFNLYSSKYLFWISIVAVLGYKMYSLVQQTLELI